MAEKQVTTKRTETPMPRYGWAGDMFADMQDRMNRMFADAWRDFPTPSLPSMGLPAVTPRVDVEEKDKAYVVTAELPGAEEKDVEVTLADNVLTIRGEKKLEAEREEKNMHVSERSYGSFRRSFRLPPECDGEKVTANFDKGVLTVSIPKTQGKNNPVKKIAIKKG